MQFDKKKTQQNLEVYKGIIISITDTGYIPKYLENML